MKLLPSMLLLAPAVALAAGPLVTTASGKLQGASGDGVESFRGIPFAAPPVGPLRWRAPQPAAGWSGVRQAGAFGHDCMQQPFAGDDAPLTTTPAEDCLYLNVWRPAGSEGKKLPVMVWIYGGGYMNGGTSPDIYSGKRFAQGGVIYVSANYRLGRFGFFGFPELSRQDADHGLLGNYGYMDQIAALKWVQANIGAFGGDPAQVTVFGNSAGGDSVHFLLTSPAAQGLFARAIVQSGGGRGALMGTRRLRDDRPDAPSAETLGLRFARRMNITGTGETALAALRALPADKVTDGLNLARRSDDAGGPMIDGVLMADVPGAVVAAARQAKVPLMIGATSGDIGDSRAASKDALFRAFGAHAQQARKAYDPDGKKDLRQLNAEVGSDRMMAEPARFVAAEFTRQGLPAYVFWFSYTATPRRPTSPYGAPHATEIPFITDTVSARYGTAATAQDQAVAKIMHAYWLNFAKTGNPNGRGGDGGILPAWPAYAPGKDWLMDFTADGQARQMADPWKARLDVTAAVAGSPAD